MKRTSGFTLIEVMVAAAIICILSALALPSFQRYVVKSKRAQAQATLLRLMQQQERYFSANNTYLGFSSVSTEADEKQFAWWSSENASASAYEIRGAACPGEPISQCVQLTALPGTRIVDAGFRDDECETLSLSSNGRRAASGPAERCWP
jgi:type IV pilus assembly protein PilE